MRALIYDGTLRVERSAANPTLGHDEALIKVQCAGICNTDLELLRGLYNFSGILGHEFVGTVVKGPAEWLERRVVGEINVACNACDFCKRGIRSQCRNRTTVGINGHPGVFADYVCLPIRNLHAVPAEVGNDAAVFVEPLAAALQILEAVQITPSQRVVVVGAGKLGMLAAQVLKLTGAELTVVVRHTRQADLLSHWGITPADIDDLERESAQVVIDCTGQAEGFASALRLVESRGTLVLKSTYQGLPPIDMTEIVVREIKLIGSRCGPFDAALRLLQSRLVDVEALIEARYSLDDAPMALAHAAQRGALKVLLDIGNTGNGDKKS
ncbi:MAG: MDR/zinc-dependent alcohol dehydrogenase-like family protein [Aggregatilineales bacterium]